MSDHHGPPKCPPSPTTIRSSAVEADVPPWPLHMAANPQYINGISPSQHYFRRSGASPPQAFKFGFHDEKRPLPPPPDAMGMAGRGTPPPQGNWFQDSYTHFDGHADLPQMPEKAAQAHVFGGQSIFNGVHGWEIPRAPRQPRRNPIPLSWRNGFERLYQSWVDNWWLWELLSWTISALCMGVIALILLIADDKPVGSTEVTLNSIISVLSGLSKAALLLPTAEALGQLKWSWFWRDTKKVEDFETFDEASRGPWGSFKLLWKTKGKTLATFGALITIVAVALDPFFQQLVVFPQQSIPSGVGLLPQVLSYTSSFVNQTRVGDIFSVPDSIMRAFVEPYVFGHELEPDIPLHCPTSNCTWEPYETLSICTSCTDISDLLDYACIDEAPLDWLSNVTTPYQPDRLPKAKTCGYWINSTSEKPMLMTGFIATTNPEAPGVEALLSRVEPLFNLSILYDPDYATLDTYFNGSIHYKNMAHPLLDFIAVSTPDGLPGVYANKTPHAEECVLSWCVKRFRSSYVNGNLSHNLMENFQPAGPTPFPWMIYNDGTPLYTQNFSFQLPGEETVFEASNHTSFQIITLLDMLFPLLITGSSHTENTIYRYPYSDVVPWVRQLWGNAWAPDPVSRVEGLAAVMSNVMMASFEGTANVNGTTWENVVYVEVRWEWMSLPFGVLFLSLIFLLSTIFKADHEKKEVGIWKTSALATLMNGFRGDVRRKMAQSSDMGEARSRAKKVTMKLTYDKKGYRLSGLPGAAWTTSPVSSHSKTGKNWI